MINRILIRLKVVQMLYSYLLTRNDFEVMSLPEGDSVEKKYSYKTYVRLLDMLIRISGYTSGKHSGLLEADKYLEKNSAARELLSVDAVKGKLLNEELYTPYPEVVIQKISNEIVASSAYRDYKKIRSKTLEDDIKFWCVIAETLLKNNSTLLSFSRKDEDFSLSAFAKGIMWLVNTLESYGSTRLSYAKAKRDLQVSLDQAYHLYVSIFGLMQAITNEQEQRLETAKTKHLVSSSELNPDMRFVNNRVITALNRCEKYNAYIKEHPITITDDPTLIRSMLDLVIQSPYYQEYMALEETDVEKDSELWKNLLRYVILPSDDLNEALESASIYWNDDLHVMGTFAIKSVKKVATDPNHVFTLLDKYKDEEDSKLGAELFTTAVMNRTIYRDYIDRFINSENWDSERIPFMDFVIMTAAIAELVSFPDIAVAVTMNEYVEIANFYSTEHSGKFINGVLFSVYNYLREKNIIQK